jgi:hypothetical protein
VLGGVGGFTLLPTLIAALLPQLRPDLTLHGMPSTNLPAMECLRRRILFEFAAFPANLLPRITALFHLLIKQQSDNNSAVAWFAP